MSQVVSSRAVKVILALVFALALVTVAAGCSKDDTTEDTTAAEVSDTALGGLSVAQSALATMAPDAKLLVVQTAEAASATSTPVWGYLFGSPSTDVTYLVYVTQGVVMSAGEYGTAGLSEAEWSAVPGVEDWLVDSPAAYDSALAVSGASGEPAAYSMGLQTYVPESTATTLTGEAFTWYVYFDPGASGATTSTIEVDAKTGDAGIWGE